MFTIRTNSFHCFKRLLQGCDYAPFLCRLGLIFWGICMYLWIAWLSVTFSIRVSSFFIYDWMNKCINDYCTYVINSCDWVVNALDIGLGETQFRFPFKSIRVCGIIVTRQKSFQSQVLRCIIWSFILQVNTTELTNGRPQYVQRRLSLAPYHYCWWYYR